MKKLFLVLFSIVFINSANAGDLSKKDMEKAWDCVGIYMANYFLPSGETFEYSMKEKSISSVKVWKAYALEIGIKEKDWDEGTNKAVDKHYGSKYNKELTDDCMLFQKKLFQMEKQEQKKQFRLYIKNVWLRHTQIDLKSKEGYKEYADKVPDTVKNFGGEYLVRAGEFKSLEGVWNFKKKCNNKVSEL